MELRNNNRQVIKTLAKVSYKNSRRRNILLIIAIALTVITIFSVFSMVTGRIDANYIMGVRAMGSDASTFLENPSKEQCDDVAKLSYVKETSKEWGLGACDPDGYPAFLCSYIDESKFDTMYKPAYTNIEGSFPKKENEVMLPVRGLQSLGIENPKPGMKIEFEVSIDEKTSDKREFVLSGYFNEYVMNSPPIGFFSKEYAQALDVNFNEPSFLLIQQDDNIEAYTIEDKLYKDIEMVSDSQQFLGGNSSTYNAVVDMYGNYNIGIGFAVLIFICMYLLINNVMSISLARDVKFYGLLKTLGTSRRQIMQIVFRQILKISCIGIAIGTMIACLIVLGILPKLMENMYLNNFGPASEMMGFHIEFLLIAIGFAFIVALISILGPARKTSKISPIEAVRYHEKASNKVKKEKGKSETKGKLSRLAWRSVFSNKRKAILTITSLILGLTLALTSVVVVNGLDYTHSIEANDDFNLSANYDALTNQNIYSDDVEVIDKDTKDAIESINGIKSINYDIGTHVLMDISEEVWAPLLKANDIEDVSGEGLTELEMKGVDIGSVGIITDKQIKELEVYIEENDLDLDLTGLQNGTHALALHFHEFSPTMTEEAKSVTDKEFSIRNWEGDDIGTMKFAGYFDMFAKNAPNVKRSAIGGQGMPGVVVTEEVYEKMGIPKRITSVYINVDDEYEPNIKYSLNAIAENRTKEIKALDPEADDLNFEMLGMVVFAKSDDLADAQNYIVSMRIVMYSIAILLMLIGIMNYYNVIATSILSRKKQFAVLEAVGMTRKQLQKMLIFEGCYYFAFVTVFLLTLGTAAMMVLGNFIKEERVYFVFSYPYIEAIIILVLLLAFCIILPLRMYQSSVRESAIERLRYVG